MMRHVAIVICLFNVAWSLNTANDATEQFYKKWNNVLNSYGKSLDRFTWTCESFQSSSPPSNVHELKPSDIQVLAALGDSVTAGNGINGRFAPQVALEVRGESWSIGGDKDLQSVVTLPNIIRNYNPDVRGYSIGIGEHDQPEAWLNAAQPGDGSVHMLEQAGNIIARMTDPNDTRGIDFENDWKMATLFIGGNDFCGYCDDREYYAPENTVARTAEALDLLHAQVPRMLVNLVPMIEITDMPDMSTGPLCDQLQWSFCPCVMNETTRWEHEGVHQGTYEEILALVDSGRYDTRDDFTVVVQTVFANQKSPRDEEGNLKKDWLSADCFHPNRDTHQIMAVSLWNTLFVPVGAKPEEQFEVPDYYCPTEEEFIKTRLN